MQRLPVLLLTTLGMLGVSCQIDGLAIGTSPGVTEDGVDAEARRSTDSTPLAEVVVNTTPEPSSEAGILAELKRRHTALADHEMIDLARTIVAESLRHDFDPALMMAVIHVESGGYHLAVSEVGALGLMQLMPGTGEELARKLDLPWRGPDTLFDPLLNVKLGIAYLRQLTDRYDSMPTALAAYNWGPGRIDRRLRRGAAVPSRYIEQVLKAYDHQTALARRDESVSG